MTDHIKKKLQEEIQQLEDELAHESPTEIKKAASLGDLSENAEYHIAKQRQTFVTRAWAHSRSAWVSFRSSTSLTFHEKSGLRFDDRCLRLHQE